MSGQSQRAYNTDAYYQHRVIPFDTLRYAKRLESVGFSAEQAEVQAETFRDIVEEQFISKRDMKDMENNLLLSIKELESKTELQVQEIQREIKALDSKIALQAQEVRREIKELDVSTRNQFELSRRDFKIWMGGMLIIAVGSLGTLTAWLTHLRIASGV